MARNLFILIFCGTITVLLGNGYFQSFRSGKLTLRRGFKRRTYRRDYEPVRYWLAMLMGTVGFLVMASATALMMFLVGVDLFGR